jgi:uncharacterized protein YbjT (DUF2867 family)
MAKLAAVLGATGSQGGGVAKVLLKAGWKVRAITRNPSAALAQALTTEGAEVVTANLDDVESLISAFQVITSARNIANFLIMIGCPSCLWRDKLLGTFIHRQRC